ncbi:hypothetical protein DBZ36_10390 [Alginatibacterium sediminis]|uniref:Polysaccharide biosynthesis protein n=1 Tax=Alginatibacterium sediminis TaxID=2164068 RepID=A0A420EDP3_9ALTE|nr:oligosaccharide flippase family protein [Alginatibacterium sediminis]RKF18793.1 hypothetical protein DBZ36_10390 [Alginatibacterium sediminis]
MQWDKLKNTFQLAIYSVLLVLQKAAGLILIPVSTRYLSLEQYGLVEVLLVLFSFCSLLEISAGTLPRFIERYSTPRQQQLLISTAFSLSLAYGSVLALLIGLGLRFSGFEVLSLYSDSQIIKVTGIIALMIALQPLLMWLRVVERVNAYAVVVLIQVVCQLSLAIAGLKSGQGIDAILNASLLGNAVALLMAVLFNRKQLALRLETGLVTSMLVYQRYLIAASMCLFVLHGFDRIFLASSLGAETLAQYAVMVKLIEAMAMCFGVLEAWWHPRRFMVLSQDGGERKVLQVHQMMLMALMLIMLSCLVLAPIVLPLLIPEQYLQGLQWLPLLVLAGGFKLATSVFDMACYLNAKPVWLFRGNAAAAVLALVCYALLVPSYGIWGLLLSLNIVYASRLVVFFYLSQSIRPLAYQSSWLFIALLLPLVFVGLSLSTLNDWFSLAALVSLAWAFLTRSNASRLKLN